MWSFHYVAVRHELLQCKPKVIQIGKFLFRHWSSPLVTKALSIPVQMRTGKLLAIGIAVGRAPKIKTHKHDRLPCTCLILPLCQVDSSTAYVKQEVFPLVFRLQGDHKCTATAWVHIFFFGRSCFR